MGVVTQKMAVSPIKLWTKFGPGPLSLKLYLEKNTQKSSSSFKQGRVMSQYPTFP